MRNPKTTIFGLLAAIGGYFATSGTGTMQVIGQTVSSISTFLLGALAKDASNNIR
jgi:hypothetical protein